MKNVRIIISGGGTGGHIFPAISIANAIKRKCPDAAILFVGAEKRMEMERVPAAGYDIVGLPVRGFNRSNPLSNIRTLIDLARSLIKARTVVHRFKPDVAVGVGGYASGPLLRAAAAMGVPTLIQEQNSYAGVTNKILSSKAAKICVAYSGMERFFPKDKILLTGNPVRKDLLESLHLRDEALTHFGLDPSKRTLIVMGGSLGARTLNESMMGALDSIESTEGVQVLWQTGRYYYASIMQQLGDRTLKNVKVMEFLQHMNLAYAAADLIVSRAGASSISECCLLGKAIILVPSPNVAEDHQTSNAMALVRADAAVLIPDSEARTRLIPEALELIQRAERLQTLRKNITKLAQPDSDERIADEILRLIPQRS